jgi:hypothetical protein
MKTGLMLASAVVTASLVISGLGARPVVAEQMQPIAVMKPGTGAGFDIGAKHAVGHYRVVAGACNLTVVVGDRAQDEGALPAAGQRFNMALLPGRSAKVDTAEGKSLEFVCGAAAQAMTVRMIERVADVPASTTRR